MKQASVSSENQGRPRRLLLRISHPHWSDKLAMLPCIQPCYVALDCRENAMDVLKLHAKFVGLPKSWKSSTPVEVEISAPSRDRRQELAQWLVDDFFWKGDFQTSEWNEAQ